MSAPVLITGPGGRVGAGLRRAFRDRFPLRLYDTQPLTPEGPNEECRVGDIADPDALTAAARGCRAIVHLAATSDEAPFVQALVPNNVVGLYHAYEAACAAQVPRFVFASTVQVLLGYPHEQFVDDAAPVRPVTRYACTKVLGEALGRFYHDRFGLEVVCLRLGAVQHPDAAERHGGAFYLSPRDCAGFVAGAIEQAAPEGGFAIISICSRSGGAVRDLTRAVRLLGYAPQDS